jgi:hypothetical protein
MPISEVEPDPLIDGTILDDEVDIVDPGTYLDFPITGSIEVLSEFPSHDVAVRIVQVKYRPKPVREHVALVWHGSQWQVAVRSHEAVLPAVVVTLIAVFGSLITWHMMAF